MQAHGKRAYITGMVWKGIGKRLRQLFQSREFGEEFFDELEDAMIEADMGVRSRLGDVGCAARGSSKPRHQEPR